MPTITNVSGHGVQELSDGWMESATIEGKLLPLEVVCHFIVNNAPTHQVFQTNDTIPLLTLFSAPLVDTEISFGADCAGVLGQRLHARRRL